MPRVIFLPGAMGAAGFWRPVADRLPSNWDKVLLAWPGLGEQPHDPSVRGLDDLAQLVEAQLTDSNDLVAQSLGGVIAIRVAARHPGRIRRLVLAVTSGATGISSEQAEDWRREYRQSYPNAAEWVTEPIPDLSPVLATIGAPRCCCSVTPTRSRPSRPENASPSCCRTPCCAWCVAAATCWRSSGPMRWRR